MKHPGSSLRAVVFDLDGTLVDTADDFIPVVQTLRVENALPAMDPRRIRASVSNGARALVTLALNLPESHPDFERWRLRLLELYGQILGRHARVYGGLRELIAQLDAAGIPWGIATNKPTAYTRPLLDMLAFTPAPGSVICPEDVQERKPHPESLLQNCRELNCRPAEMIYVGDHQRDIEAGRRAGAFTIAASYGYIEDGDDSARWGADAVAQSSTQLAGLILSAQ